MLTDVSGVGLHHAEGVRATAKNIGKITHQGIGTCPKTIVPSVI